MTVGQRAEDLVAPTGGETAEPLAAMLDAAKVLPWVLKRADH